MTLALVLLLGGGWRDVVAGAQAEAYRYEFEQPRFLVTRIVIALDAAGRGTLEYVEQDAPEPIRAPVALRPESLARLQQLAAKVAALPPQSPSEKHANLGLSKLTLVVSGKPACVAFTYTQQPDALELARFFRGLVTQHQRVEQIQVARRYQPLDVPKLLRDLEVDLNAQRIAEPAALSDLLGSLAGDLRLSLIARNHARRLQARVNRQ